MARRKPSRIFKRLLIVVAAAGLVFLGLAAFRAGPEPSVLLGAGLPGIGKRTPIDIVVEEPKRGLAGFRVELVQGDRVEVLAEREYRPLDPWEFWGQRKVREDLKIEIGSETVEGL
jgi:Holliday junction resolvasome RuvABC ATP-dependent DNA helicase subunit